MFCGHLTVLAQFLLSKSELLLHTLTVSSPMLLCHFLNSLIQLRTVLRGHTTRAVLKFRFFDSSTVWRKVTTCEQSTNVLTNANLKIMTDTKLLSISGCRLVWTKQRFWSTSDLTCKTSSNVFVKCQHYLGPLI